MLPRGGRMAPDETRLEPGQRLYNDCETIQHVVAVPRIGVGLSLRGIDSPSRDWDGAERRVDNSSVGVKAPTTKTAGEGQESATASRSMQGAIGEDVQGDGVHMNIEMSGADPDDEAERSASE
jgi:hypothetical protein